MSSFRSRLANGELLVGTMVTLDCPSVGEILSEVGFDWLFVDAEHGPYDTTSLLAMLQAVAGRTPCIVRVPSVDEATIKRVLDLGADGIIAPQINTAEEAADVVRWCKYAPQGSRGVGLARAHSYGFTFAEYVEQANDHVTVVVQTEHAQSVENIESIVEVPGIDAVLIGPYDLSASLDRMGQVDDPVVVGAIDRVTKTCQAANIPLGVFGVTAGAVRPYLEQGYKLIVAGVDALMLGNAARRMKDAVTGAE